MITRVVNHHPNSRIDGLLPWAYVASEQRLLHIGIVEARTYEGKLHMLVAINRTSKLAFVELHERVSRRTAADFLCRRIKAFLKRSTPC